MFVDKHAWAQDMLFLLRINPHEAKQNIHLRPTSISRTLFRFFGFSGTSASVGLSKSRDTGAAQKKELACPIQRATQSGQPHPLALFCTTTPFYHSICTTYSPFYHSMFNNIHHSNCSLFVLFQTGHVSIVHNFSQVRPPGKVPVPGPGRPGDHK